MNEVVDEIYENETAEELYERIQREKEKLISEGKLKKQKKLTEISEDEIPFEIPKSWKWVRLGEVGITQTGTTPSTSKKEYFGDYIPFVSPADILNYKINYNNNGLSEDGMNVGRVSEKNSILQVCIGGSIGKTAITSKKISYNQQINAIATIICNYKYIFYAMISKYFLDNIIYKSTGTATPIINKSIWESILIPLPPLSEQKRISELIDRLFEKLDEAKEKALSALNTFELRKAKILHLAIQGKLSKQLDEYETAEELYEKIQIEKEKLISEGKLKKQKKLPEISQDEIPFEIPKSWKWVRLGESSINIHYGYTTSSTLKGNFKLLRITDIQNNKVDWNKVPFCDIDDSEYSKYALKDGDILIARTGGTVGKSYRVEFLSDKCVFASYLIRVIVSKEMNSKYLKYFMENSLYWNQLKVGITGTGQPNVNAVTLSKLFLPLPPLEEQNEIVKLLDNIFEKEEKAKKLIESTLNKIELIKKSILARAVRGEL